MINHAHVTWWPLHSENDLQQPTGSSHVLEDRRLYTNENNEKVKMHEEYQRQRQHEPTSAYYI